MKVSVKERKNDNYDTYLTLLDIAVAMKNVADVILSDERNILKVLEGMVKRMDRMEEMLDTYDPGDGGVWTAPFIEGRER